MAEFIDRQKVLDLTKTFALDIDWVEDPMYLEFSYVATNVIKNIPAADVRPVVRGKWIGNKRHQSCSECHMTYCVPDGQDGELDMTAYHFCPNCGAMMEES